MTSVQVAFPFIRQPIPAGNKHLLSMAALTQSTNEPVAISNPLSGTPSSLISSPPESVAFLKPSKQDPSLTSIASAGLHVSRSRESVPQMPTTAPTEGPMDRPQESERASEQNSSLVAREALGASEKQNVGSIHDSMTMSSDHMQIDSAHTSGSVPETFGTADSGSTLMAAPTVASPGPIEDSTSQDGDRPRHRDETDLQESSNKSFSYPLPTGPLGDARRGLSLPNSGFQKSGQRSPSAKSTVVLTEKPYVCQTCQSRFRRLHDLKRHTKLHTGERPHICPKCGRRFARGDALARHNKGQGGCAGRRASMGSYAPEDDYGEGVVPPGAEDAMDGLVYAEPERMDEEDERRLNMPSIKKHDAPSDSIPRSHSGSSYQPRQPNTYPPIAAGRPSPGGLFPPPTSHGGSSASTSPVSQSGNMTFPPPGQPSGASVFQSTNVTESPRPLSPNALTSHQVGHGPEGGSIQLHRSHSPGMSQSFQQQPFSRSGPSQGPVTNHAAPGLGLPPPQPGAPQLPPPPGMGPSDTRFPLHNPGAVQPPPSAATKHGSSLGHSTNHSGSLSSKAGMDATAGHGTHLPGPHDPSFVEQSRDREDKLWAYIRSVHEELAGLKSEVAVLRSQLASSNVSNLAPSNTSAATAQPESSSGSTGQR
ncbi:transcriptional regulator CRZ1 [Aspergillus udagawae]|uniref:Transcriptional regulator CRZ1 n=1 Tax=Aspergillus udagawae TaxID=91492 RepID=A0ABQ1A4P3_9EURO|nr:transcriptional regulator CRZ1 [Aspergillus udagawae]